MPCRLRVPNRAGSMQVGFLMALAGVSVRESFHNAGCLWRTRVPFINGLRAKTSDIGKTPKVIQVLFRGDVIER